MIYDVTIGVILGLTIFSLIEYVAEYIDDRIRSKRSAARLKSILFDLSDLDWNDKPKPRKKATVKKTVKKKPVKRK